jgi:hypothetical protein
MLVMLFRIPEEDVQIEVINFELIRIYSLVQRDALRTVYYSYNEWQCLDTYRKDMHK